MMKTTGYRLLLLLGGFFILLAGLSPALAQDKEKKVVKKEVIVKVDEDGNITINGEPAEEGEIEMSDGTRMIVDKEGGRVIVIEEDEEGRKVVRRRRHVSSGDDDEDFVFFESEEGGEPKIFRHRIRVPDVDDEVHVLMEKLGEAPHGVMRWRSGDDEKVFSMRRPAPLFLDEDFDFDFDFEFANSDIVKMETETRKLAREIMNAEGAEKRQLEEELSNKLNEIFDMKLESRKKRIKKLQKRLEKQQADLREREESRADIIDRRRDELLGDDRLEW